MEYRIKEVKDYGPYKSVFYPQRRSFLVWRNIANDYSFAISVSNPIKMLDEYRPYTYAKWEAEAAINAHKLWSENNKGYVKIHKPL
jgi:hypothetical protein